MVQEIEHVQRKTLASSTRLQIAAFILSSVGGLVSISVVNFSPPSVFMLTILILGILSTIGGMLILFQVWWITTIRQKIVTAPQSLRILGLILFLLCLITMAWLLWINQLLNLTVSILLLTISLVYYRFNRSWGLVDNETLAKKRATSTHF